MINKKRRFLRSLEITFSEYMGSLEAFSER